MQHATGLQFTTDFISCVFVDNVTSNETSGGGAVYCEVAGRLEECTFVANRTANNGNAGLGGAIYSKTDIPRISNCAFTNNVAANGGAIYIKESKLNELAESTFVYTPVQTDNVTNVAPKFVEKDAKYPNAPYYMPRRSSPLRNAGMCFSWMEESVDFAGNARVIEGAPDIGCYECNLQPYGTTLIVR